MFRCITKVRGLVFDIDGFSNGKYKKIVECFGGYKILFMTLSAELADEIEDELGKEYVYKMEEFQKYFAPNIYTHLEVIKKLGIQATELVYVSKRLHFLKNAMNFIGGTVWVTKEMFGYDKASQAPDLICRSLKRFSNLLEREVDGFFGEVVVYPDNSRTEGVIIELEFESEYVNVPLYMMGRYFGYTHYMSQLHPYSSAIYLNKKISGKCYGKYNKIFQGLYIAVIKLIQERYKIDGVCAVPPRPHCQNRFATILDNISDLCCIDNYGSSLICAKDYPSQKGLSSEERQENIKDVFAFTERLRGENIIIIDDIITTGATLSECIKVLKAAGAGDIYIVVLAVNQCGWNYWTSNVVQIRCPRCNEKMNLLINSRKLTFFYSCYNCGNTLDFKDGRMQLINSVNQEQMG